MKDHTFKPYEVCRGRRYRYLPKLYRPVSITLYSKVCNINFIEKNKIRFINQYIRLFIKEPNRFKNSGFLKVPYTFKDKTYIISNGDIIYVSCWTLKAAWKKLLSRLNYELIDYKILKRRKYSLNFIFFFIELDKYNKEITLDIICTQNDSYEIFITLNSYYIKDFSFILEYLKIWKI